MLFAASTATKMNDSAAVNRYLEAVDSPNIAVVILVMITGEKKQATAPTAQFTIVVAKAELVSSTSRESDVIDWGTPYAFAAPMSAQPIQMRGIDGPDTAIIVNPQKRHRAHRSITRSPIRLCTML